MVVPTMSSTARSISRVFSRVMAFVQGPGASTSASLANFEHYARPEEAERVINYMSQLIPAIRGRQAQRTKGCIYAYAPDQNYIVGRHPEHANVTVGAAFSSHGFKFVPVIGEILADLALDGLSGRNIDMFSPSRFSTVASPSLPGRSD
jgi:sarcosine oxidase